jgi:hypothetical protein
MPPKQTPLDTKEVAQNILSFVRTATARVYPQLFLRDSGHTLEVRLFHRIPFTADESQWLKTMIRERAEEYSVCAINVSVQRSWIKFILRTKKDES